MFMKYVQSIHMRIILRDFLKFDVLSNSTFQGQAGGTLSSPSPSPNTHEKYKKAQSLWIEMNMKAKKKGELKGQNEKKKEKKKKKRRRRRNEDEKKKKKEKEEQQQQQQQQPVRKKKEKETMKKKVRSRSSPNLFSSLTPTQDGKQHKKKRGTSTPIKLDDQSYPCGHHTVAALAHPPTLLVTGKLST